VATDFPNLPLDTLPWWALGAVVLVFGILTCLHGYKNLKLVLFLLGFVSVFYAGLLCAPLLFPDDPKVVWITASVLGLVLGILMNFFYKAGVFILGAYVTAVFFLPFLQSLDDIAARIQSLDDIAARGVLVLTILVGGFAALRLEKWPMKVATAFAGAWHAVQSAFFLFKLSPFLFPWEQILDKYGGASLHDIFNRPWYFWTSVLGLSLAGFYSQIKRRRKKA
jgi:hypothetical protein